MNKDEMTKAAADFCDGCINPPENWDRNGTIESMVQFALQQLDPFRVLLYRIRQWDHLDTAADGDYWKTEIDKVMGQALRKQFGGYEIKPLNAALQSKQEAE
jgi:hypothetical protein